MNIEAQTTLEISCLREGAQTWDPLPLLRGVMGLVETQVGADDYKSSAAALSGALFDVLLQWVEGAQTSAARREYKRLLAEAGRRGLLSGQDCPRSTLAAWAATKEV